MNFRSALRPSFLPALIAGLALSFASACESKDAASKSGPDPKVAVAATGATAATGAAAATGNATPPEATAAKGKPLDRVLAYLDPDARAVLITRDFMDVDPDAFSAVMGVPPGAARLLDSRRSAREGLAHILHEDVDALKTWLAPEMLVMTPAVAMRDYIVGRTTGDKKTLGKKLSEAGMRTVELDGATFYLPSNSYRFKLTFLEDDILAFIPMEEMGAGLSPLTAGRDLPESKMRTDLGAMFDRDSEIAMALHAGGPMLHLDLGTDVISTQVGVRNEGRSAAVQIVLEPTRDPDAAVVKLNAREHHEESHQVQALMKRVAFRVDNKNLIAEILLSHDDLELLR